MNGQFVVTNSFKSMFSSRLIRQRSEQTANMTPSLATETGTQYFSKTSLEL